MEFLEHDDAYVCAYCDTRYPKPAPVVQPAAYTQAVANVQPTASKNQKNKWIAFFLCVFLGVYGVHKFYENKVGMGLLYLFTGGIFGVGWIIDCIVLLFKPNPYEV